MNCFLDWPTAFDDRRVWHEAQKMEPHMDMISIVLVAVFLVLALAELLLPGGIAISIALSALLMAGLRFFGLIVDPITTFSLLPVIALIFMVVFFKVLNRYFSGEATQDMIPDDIEINNDVVNVLADISEEDPNGRVRFQGTSWQALSQKGKIAKGGKARVVSREGLVLIVERVDEIPYSEANADHLAREER